MMNNEEKTNSFGNCIRDDMTSNDLICSSEIKTKIENDCNQCFPHITRDALRDILEKTLIPQQESVLNVKEEESLLIDQISLPDDASPVGDSNSRPALRPNGNLRRSGGDRSSKSLIYENSFFEFKDKSYEGIAVDDEHSNPPPTPSPLGKILNKTQALPLIETESHQTLAKDFEPNNKDVRSGSNSFNTAEVFNFDDAECFAGDDEIIPPADACTSNSCPAPTVARRPTDVLLLDCRPFIAYNAGHIVSAQNVYFPNILQRRCQKKMRGVAAREREGFASDGISNSSPPPGGRAANRSDLQSCDVENNDSTVAVDDRSRIIGGDLGPSYASRSSSSPAMPLESVVTCATTRGKLMSSGFDLIVIYDDDMQDGLVRSSNRRLFAEKLNAVGNSLQAFLPFKQFSKMRCLLGGYSTFAEFYPHLVEKQVLPENLTSKLHSSSVNRAAGSGSPVRDRVKWNAHDDQDDPTEVMPWLFLGSVHHAERTDRLLELGITALLDVTSKDPERSASSPKSERQTCFLQACIPVVDNLTSNIECHFHSAISFIEKVHQENGKVLVHCSAGVSRSPALCLAYLIGNFGYTLEGAYDFLRSKRACIAPNLNFMRQLQEFEKNSKCRDVDEARDRDVVGNPGSEMNLDPDVAEDEPAADCQASLRRFRDLRESKTTTNDGCPVGLGAGKKVKCCRASRKSLQRCCKLYFDEFMKEKKSLMLSLSTSSSSSSSSSFLSPSMVRPSFPTLPPIVLSSDVERPPECGGGLQMSKKDFHLRRKRTRCGNLKSNFAVRREFDIPLASAADYLCNSFVQTNEGATDDHFDDNRNVGVGDVNNNPQVSNHPVLFENKHREFPDADIRRPDDKSVGVSQQVSAPSSDDGKISEGGAKVLPSKGARPFTLTNNWQQNILFYNTLLQQRQQAGQQATSQQIALPALPFESTSLQHSSQHIQQQFLLPASSLELLHQTFLSNPQHLRRTSTPSSEMTTTSSSSSSSSQHHHSHPHLCHSKRKIIVSLLTPTCNQEAAFTFEPCASPSAIGNLLPSPTVCHSPLLSPS